MKNDRLLIRLQRLSLPARASLLAGSLLLAAGLVLPVAYSAKGSVGVVAAFVAALVCLVPGLVALGVSEIFRGPDSALYSLLIGTLVRMGLPLVVLVVVYASGGPLVEGGMAFSLLAFYPVMLLVETCCSPRRSNRSTNRREARK